MHTSLHRQFTSFFQPWNTPTPIYPCCAELKSCSISWKSTYIAGQKQCGRVGGSREAVCGVWGRSESVPAGLARAGAWWCQRAGPKRDFGLPLAAPPRDGVQPYLPALELWGNPKSDPCLGECGRRSGWAYSQGKTLKQEVRWIFLFTDFLFVHPNNYPVRNTG